MATSRAPAWSPCAISVKSLITLVTSNQKEQQQCQSVLAVESDQQSSRRERYSTVNLGHGCQNISIGREMQQAGIDVWSDGGSGWGGTCTDAGEAGSVAAAAGWVGRWGARSEGQVPSEGPPPDTVRRALFHSTWRKAMLKE